VIVGSAPIDAGVIATDPALSMRPFVLTLMIADDAEPP
jgi:hypothetical protein